MSLKPIFFTRIQSYRPWITVKEIPLTVLALAWLIFNLYLTSFVNGFLDGANPFVKIPLSQRSRVYDPVLELLHPIYVKLGFAWNFPDPLCSFSLVVYFMRVALGGRDSLLILRRLCYVVGLGYLIRNPFVMMTMLPNPNLDCTIDPNPNLFLYALEALVQLKHTCGDVVYSGHTILFMSASLIWIENPVHCFSKKTTFLLNLFLIFYSAFGVTIMVASTYHYTVDCVISAMTMLFLWKYYHFVVHNNNLDDQFFGESIKKLDGANYKSSLPSPVTLQTSPLCDMSDIVIS